MKISIVTWDACFRESFHTIDSFGKQDYNKNQYEFIWSDFYNNQNKNLKNKINNYSNFSLYNNNNDRNKKWHLGKIINNGIKQTNGDILVIPDGDIIVPDYFLKKVENIFNNNASDNLVCYFRRWDEPKESHGVDSYNIKHLEKKCELRNLHNYGGCLAIKYKTFKEIGFYEEHDIFSGPSASGFEQYKRFRNKGLKIMWSDVPIFHPYHNFTGSSDKFSFKLKIAANNFNWIIPYNGFEQSWILYMRDKNLDWKANDGSIDRYLKELKSINYYIIPQNIRKILNRIKHRK